MIVKRVEQGARVPRVRFIFYERIRRNVKINRRVGGKDRREGLFRCIIKICRATKPASSGILSSETMEEEKEEESGLDLKRTGNGIGILCS